MSKNSLQRTAAVLAVLAIPALSLAQGHAGSPRVAVRVYGGASSDAASRAAAIRIAASIVAEAGVAATWLDCTGDSLHPRCPRARASRELVIRIAPTYAAGTVAPRGSIQSQADGSSAGLVLGFAVVEPATGAGALATVFLDRIVATAQRTSSPAGALLGRAIAHEVGHLLLGTNVHARSGLMREFWTDAELMLDRPEDWRFADPERIALGPYTTR